MAETGINDNQVTTNVGNLTGNTAIWPRRGPYFDQGHRRHHIYTVGASGTTVGYLLTPSIHGVSANNRRRHLPPHYRRRHRTNFTAALSNGNLQITDGNNNDLDLTAIETADTNLNEVTSGTGGLPPPPF